MDKRHLKNLGGIVKENRKARAVDANIDKVRKDRLKDINDAKTYSLLGFWCDQCCKDFEAIGLKQTRSMETDMPIAFYGALCPKGHLAVRRITDKLNDPYFWQSENIRRSRAEHEDDFLTPDDPRFQYVYPEQWKRIQEERVRREEESAVLTK